MHDDSLIVQRNPRIVSRDLGAGRGALLLDPKTAAYHRVNEIGALIWRLLERPHRFIELVDRLRDASAEAPESLRDDVAAYVADLAERDLLRLEPPRDGH